VRGNTKQREDIVMEVLSLIGTLVLVGFISWLVVPILVGLVVFAVYLALFPFRILFNLLRGGD
jgi:Flp pilus assembly protein TadB